MLDGGAEPQSSPASRAGVGEGEGEGLAQGAGGPGLAAGRAGSVVETQRALLLLKTGFPSPIIGQNWATCPIPG